MSAEKGMGEAGRRIAEAVKGTGLPTHVVRRSSRNTRQAHSAQPQYSEDLVYRNSILVVNADQVAAAARSLGLDPMDRGRTIGVWFWELEEFPSHLWPGVFDYVDEIWAGSDFLQKSFSNVAPVPVERIILEVPKPHVPAGLKRHHVGLDDSFTFLFTFDANSVMARKNPHGVIDAYREAFPERGDTKLLIRAINGHRHQHAFDALVARAKDRPDIRVLDEWLTAPLAQAQLALADCFVSLHRSEGFGYNIAGAMAAGTPTIATNYSGNLDYMTDENSWLIPASITPVGPGAIPYAPTSRWADPDLSAASRAMRDVVQNYDEARRRAKLGQRDLEANHSYDAAVQGIARILARHAREWN
jgi:glycosyltransferase involved in cell wall biosynthesis